jgi:hypothetical protein
MNKNKAKISRDNSGRFLWDYHLNVDLPDFLNDVHFKALLYYFQLLNTAFLVCSFLILEMVSAKMLRNPNY